MVIGCGLTDVTRNLLSVTAPCATAKAMAARGRVASAKQGREPLTGNTGRYRLHELV